MFGFIMKTTCKISMVLDRKRSFSFTHACSLCNPKSTFNFLQLDTFTLKKNPNILIQIQDKCITFFNAYDTLYVYNKHSGN